MTFFAPWAAWFFAGIPVIVLLYLLKLKRRPLTVSTLLFWERVLQENPQRALFQKLRHLLSLLLHLLIFLLIIGALAKPAFDRLLRNGASVVLIVDTRARMHAQERGGETRFTKALREARKLVRAAGPQRQIAIVEAGATPRVAAAFSGDERALLEGLNALVPTDAGGEMQPAIALADALLAARHGDAQIVVLSDAPLAGETPRTAAKVDFIACGSALENVAITRFATRPLLSSPETSEVLLIIQNFGRATVGGNVEIAFDGKLLDVKPFTLEGGAVKTEVFASVPRPLRSGRGWLTARLDTKDALAIDDIAYAVLPAAQPRQVLLVSTGNWFLENLLKADQQIHYELILPEAWSESLAAKFDAVIFDRLVPSGFDLRARSGNFLFIKQSPFTSAEPPLERPVIEVAQAGNPLMRLVNWQNVTIVRAAVLQTPDAADGWTFETPLRFADHPLLLTGTRRSSAGEQRLAALAFEVADSDLPLRIAFPLLMANTVHWLAGEASTPVASERAGANLALPADARIASLPQTSIDAAPTPTAPSVTGFFQPLRNGFYQLEQPAGASWLAVNTFSAAESNLQISPGENARAVTLPAVTWSGLVSRPIWQYLAIAALVLCTAEWWLFHRRRTE